MTYEPIWKSTPETWSHLKDAARQNRRNPTRAEVSLWQHLRAGRLNGLKFRRQHAVGPYIVDFYCPAARLVIELDGPIHRFNPQQDAERTRFISMMGLRLVRFTNDQVIIDPESVLEAIRASCQRLPYDSAGND